MKNLKINFGFVALLLGSFIAFAFKAPEAKQNAPLAVQWFSYNGLGASDPQNYSELPAAPDCDGSAALCAIQAEEDGVSGRPTQAGVDNPISIRKEL